MKVILDATEKENTPNVKMELNNCIALNYKNIEKEFLFSALRNRMEKYTISEEFDVSFFAKKALKEIFDAKFPIFEV
jgi:hypothetical protein